MADGSPRLIQQTTVDSSVRYLIFTLMAYLRDEAGYEVWAACAPGPYVPEIAAAGYRVLRVPMTRRITPLPDLLTLARLVWRYRRARPLIVHTHTPKAGLLGQLAARLAGVPIVCNTIHGFYFQTDSPAWQKLLFGFAERLAAHCSDAIFVLNPEDAATARAMRLAPDSKLIATGSGIDLAGFGPERLAPEERGALLAELGIPAGAPIVGFVGRLVREKGVLELLAAVPHVARRLPGVHLLLIGAWDRARPDAVDPRAVAERGLTERVHVLGHRTDVERLYPLMDVLALPTYREGYPRAPMEAAASGVPTVATDVRGCRQTVVHGETGLLVPPRDASALAGALIELLADDERRRRMGGAARRLALERFDERRVFQLVAETYDCLRRRKGLA